MDYLEDFQHMRQDVHKNNTCWLACAAMVCRYILDPNMTEEMVVQKLGVDGDQMGSAPDAILSLYRQYVSNDTRKSKDLIPCDEYTIPTFQEIQKEIKGEGQAGKPRPLLCCVGVDEPKSRDAEGRPLVQKKYQNGHCVVIIGAGYNDNGIPYLYVADPAYDGPIYVPYCQSQYVLGLYWENTTYFNF